MSSYSDQVPQSHHHQMPDTATTTTIPTNANANNVIGSTTAAKLSSSISSSSPPSVVFNNCDVDIYYKDHKNGEWSWNRYAIASLLLLTHRQVIPYDEVNDYPSSGSGTNIRKALIELDKGVSNENENENESIDTVHMIFTQSDIPVVKNNYNNNDSFGWQPGYLWPMDDLVASNSDDDSKTNKDDELLAASHDLHNIRPRHPIVNNDQLTKNWYYDACDDCKFGFVNNNNGNDDEITTTPAVVQQRIDDSTSSSSESDKIGGGSRWNGIIFDNTMDNDDDEGSDHLCVCTKEHALQPPESARGEIARALLYMNLRYYGTLNLTLTDCNPQLNNNNNDNGNNGSNISMGYFTRLIQWHLDDPPSREEFRRNTKICELYQGNRNPFIDFYEESWALLDFDHIDGEVCKEGNEEKEENDDDYYDDDIHEAEEEEELSSSTDEPTPVTTMFMGCHQFLTGDISFFMVQPAGDSNSNEESFGLVTLVDLKPGLVLFVAGVDDDDDDDDKNNGLRANSIRDAGILKVVVPDQGIKAGQYFGYGSQMYLGDQWEPILEDGNGELARGEFRFSVRQLYLYCIDEEAKDEDEDDMGIGKNDGKEEYNILAALSTTGRSFGNGLLPSSFWGNYQHEHSNVELSDNFRDVISSNYGGSNYYGVIVLPGDASDLDISGGYRYTGPAYTKQDQYAKALINEAYWERMNTINVFDSIDNDEKPVIRSSSEEEQQQHHQQQQRDGNTAIKNRESSNSGNGPHSTLRMGGLSHYWIIMTSLALPLGILFW